MRKMKRNVIRIPRSRQRGFSLLELLIAVVILTFVIAVVVRGVTELQKSNSSQAVNIDLTQESRQFMDQVVEDLHQAGYPPPTMFDAATAAASPNSVANGLIEIHTNWIQYEGDVDGTGVSEIFVQLSPAGGPCPCTLRRGALSKVSYSGGSAPTYYTEVDGVMNLNVFTAYDKAGNTVALPCTAGVCADGTAIQNVKDIGLLLNVRSAQVNPVNQNYSFITVSTEAKVN